MIFTASKHVELYNIRSKGYGMIALIFFTKVQIVTLYDNTVTNDNMSSKNTLDHSHRITNLLQSTKSRKMQLVIFSLVVPVFKAGNP